MNSGSESMSMDKSSPFPVGKLPAELLARLLAGLPGHPRLTVGPRVGEGAQENDYRAQIVSGHREGESDVVLHVELLSDAVRRDNPLNGSGYT